MRRLAPKVFVDYNSQQVLKRAVNARTRTVTEYRPGDYVFVYRVPKVRRQKDGSRQAVEIGSNRPMWVGPGAVIVADGPNLWISMMGQLWRVAREQCRPATNNVRTGVEEIMNQCREPVEEYKHTSRRAGYRDITAEPWPPLTGKMVGEGEERDTPGPAVAHGEDAEEYTPSVAGPDVHEEPVQTVEADTPREAEAEEPTAQTSSSSSPTNSTSRTSGNGVPQDPLPSTELRLRPDLDDMWRQYRTESDRLDGIPRWQALRARGSRQDLNPYMHHYLKSVEDDADDQHEEEQWRLNVLAQWAWQGRGEKDSWELDWGSKTLRRTHVRKRRARFDVA